ncbi:MAG TPA: hypothetical protein ENH82_18975 [bacterium]|nr:hypothetical protein [bacterium]
MEQVSETIKKKTGEFLENIKESFGENLRSVILYGLAARGEEAKHPYINFMVIVDDNTPSELARCVSFTKKWRKELITTPLFLDTGYIQKSLDTFPLEFLDMLSAYHVVHGDDVLEDLDFKMADVRNQCERELKGKLLHLRAEYLNLRSDKKGLMDLVNRSLNTFRLVFAGALFLKNIEIPKDTGTLLIDITETYELDASLFKKLRAMAKGEIKVDETEADKLFDLYVEELDKLSHAIDEMTDIQDVRF